MKVGDLVYHRLARSCKHIGVVIEVRHARTEVPDYRTPTEVLVYFSKNKNKFLWMGKNELEIVRKGGSP